MTKKLTWEVDKTSLVLRISDGDRKTEWIVRKSTTTEKLRGFLGEMLLELTDELAQQMPIGDARPMIESAHTVDAEELAELQRYQHNETSEEASRAAQAAYVDKLNINAKWFETDDDETYGIPIPDYDSGEVRPR